VIKLVGGKKKTKERNLFSGLSFRPMKSEEGEFRGEGQRGNKA